MTMPTASQPDALRLAEKLETWTNLHPVMKDAAAELAARTQPQPESEKGSVVAPPATYGEQLAAGADCADTLLAIGRRIGFGRAQQILGDQWDAEYGCAPRGRMGVTVKDDPTAPPSAPAFYISHEVIDPATGKMAAHVKNALTWSDKPTKNYWTVPVYVGSPPSAPGEHPAAAAEPYLWGLAAEGKSPYLDVADSRKEAETMAECENAKYDEPRYCVVPLYIGAVPQQAPLTDEQWIPILRAGTAAFFAPGCKSVQEQMQACIHATVRATEAAHGISAAKETSNG